tara:strand:+ start:53 stop:1360 length:1308 start_codon:yes stop_codon:yes gene_type:complete
MKWESVLKRPVVDVPEPDRYFEYNPKLLEQIVKDWDKDNPAKVIHIEAPSTPDPDMRMDDDSIRFAPRGSKKFIKDAFRFITDRPIDDITGLKNRLREEGYTITTLGSKWVRENYGEKIGRIAVPDEAVAHIIGVTPKIADAQRQRPENRGRAFRMPDRSRKVEDIQRWNEQKERHNLGTLRGFTDFINYWVSVNNISFDISEKTRKMLSEGFGRNKHDLYLSQQLMLNDTWINQNIIKPVANMALKERRAEEERERESKRKAQEEKESRRQMDRKRSLAGQRKRSKTSDSQIQQLERRLSAAQRAGDTKRAKQLQDSIDAIKERNRKLESGEVEKMWEEIIKRKNDYRFGRCQASRSREAPDTCIRPLQSPERRKAAGSDPQGKTCMFCEDDQSRYANTPKELWSSEGWYKLDPKEQAKRLDAYVKRNPKYKEE